MITRPAIFKWRQTEPGLIVCAVRWYLRYSLSLRDVEELLEERGSPCRSHNSLEAVKKPRIRIGVNSSAKKIASGCPINVRGSIGIHFPSILKLRKSSQTGFFTASLALGAGLRPGVGAATATASQADKQVVAGGRNLPSREGAAGVTCIGPSISCCQRSV